MSPRAKPTDFCSPRRRALRGVRGSSPARTRAKSRPSARKNRGPRPAHQNAKPPRAAPVADASGSTPIPAFSQASSLRSPAFPPIQPFQSAPVGVIINSLARAPIRSIVASSVHAASLPLCPPSKAPRPAPLAKTSPLRGELSALKIDRGRRRKTSPLAVVAWLLVGAGLVGAAGGAACWTLKDRLFPLPVVKVDSVRIMTLGQARTELTATGYLESRWQAAVGAKVPGRIANIPVEEGDKVKAGDVLAELEHSDLDAMLASRKVAVAAGRSAAGRGRVQPRPSQARHGPRARRVRPQRRHAGRARARRDGVTTPPRRFATPASPRSTPPRAPSSKPRKRSATCSSTPRSTARW